MPNPNMAEGGTSFVRPSAPRSDAAWGGGRPHRPYRPRFGFDRQHPYPGGPRGGRPSWNPTGGDEEGEAGGGASGATNAEGSEEREGGFQPRHPRKDIQMPNPYRNFLQRIQRAQEDPDYDGKRLRKNMMRKTVDYYASINRMIENRIYFRDHRDRPFLQPQHSYYQELEVPMGYRDTPLNAVCTKFVRTATNKMRCPIFCMSWTPNGQRLVTGASSGEFTLWNGLTFNFETILQAHDNPVRAMCWARSNIWMITGDHGGFVKYWQPNMNNVIMFQAHKEPVRDVSFSPTDGKFATGSDDGSVRVWDFNSTQEEKILRGHGSDVKCVKWHPVKALLASGSKDNQQPLKLWCPKSGTSIATLHVHKSTVMDLSWNQNGNWLLTASRDHLLKLFDIRKMNVELQVFRGHKKEASCVAWHPVHEGLFASGGSDGSLMYWHVGCQTELGSIEAAHESIVWCLAWHPLGHVLSTGSNDHTTRFWTRNRPGDPMKDSWNLGTNMESRLNNMHRNTTPGHGRPGSYRGHAGSQHHAVQNRIALEKKLEAIKGIASASLPHNIPGMERAAEGQEAEGDQEGEGEEEEVEDEGTEHQDGGPHDEQEDEESEEASEDQGRHGRRGRRGSWGGGHFRRGFHSSKPIPRDFQMQWNEVKRMPLLPAPPSPDDMSKRGPPGEPGPPGIDDHLMGPPGSGGPLRRGGGPDQGPIWGTPDDMDPMDEFAPPPDYGPPAPRGGHFGPRGPPPMGMQRGGPPPRFRGPGERFRGPGPQGERFRGPPPGRGMGMGPPGSMGPSGSVGPRPLQEFFGDREGGLRKQPILDDYGPPPDIEFYDDRPPNPGPLNGYERPPGPMGPGGPMRGGPMRGPGRGMRGGGSDRGMRRGGRRGGR